MLKKSLYLYAMMIFSITALQATEDLPSKLTEQTMARCPRCPRSSSSSSSSSSSCRFALAVVEDDNKETGNLLSLSTEKENDPTDLSACHGRGRKHRRHHRDHKDSKPQEVACDEKDEEANNLLACGKRRNKSDSDSDSSEKRALACPNCGDKGLDVLFACEKEKENEMRILPVSA